MEHALEGGWEWDFGGRGEGMVPPRCTSARFGILISYHMELDDKNIYMYELNFVAFLCSVMSLWTSTATTSLSYCWRLFLPG